MISKSKIVGETKLNKFEGHIRMIPFNMRSLKGVPKDFKENVKSALSSIKNKEGEAYLEIEGKFIKKQRTLRRPGAHIDGNYKPSELTFGPKPYMCVDFERQFKKKTGGIILVTNYASSIGWNGDFCGEPKKGGDCSHFNLGECFELKEDAIYYGNNHFIHESLPLDKSVHRTFMRITLPEDHEYEC